MSTATVDSSVCFHCSDPLPSKPLFADNHSFCCNGCKEVYLLLSDSNLGQYYQEGIPTGVKPTDKNYYFEQFDLPELQSKWITFQEGNTVKVELHLPQIHCASCIYLLEHLHKLNPGIQFSTVNFPNKTASIIYDKNEIKLSEIAHLLTRIGYTPDFSENRKKKTGNKRLLYQLGVAGFAFGSIMLWSFPEYLHIDKTYFGLRNLSSWLSFFVSIPVLFYSSQDYFKAAIGALKTKHLNLDIPITIGIIALYVRSCYAIFNNEGPGYMDSFSGFIFFLLIGKWFQGKTFQWLAFDRDYRSYFPVAILKKEQEELLLTPIEELKVGDRIMVRNEEIVPADSILISDLIFVDYSFVTGEAEWVKKESGDFIYAGGKLCNASAELEVVKSTDRSNLVSLWNNSEKTSHDGFVIRQDRLAKKFIMAMLIIAALSSFTWWFIDPSVIPGMIAAVLIVACPCALALAGPFTFGNMLRKLGKHGFYIRSTTVIEKLQQVDTIVFDKTGTLSNQTSNNCIFSGEPISREEAYELLVLTEHAVHPYSRSIHSYIRTAFPEVNLVKRTEIAEEFAGQGISNNSYKLGKADFCEVDPVNEGESVVYWSIDGHYRGNFRMESSWRDNIEDLVRSLGEKYRLIVLSGDKNTDEIKLRSFFPAETQYYFNQQPHDKKQLIRQLNAEGRKTLMIGDGLNDAGALQESFTGIAISEDLVRFTPASDAIMKGDHLVFLNDYLNYIQKGKQFLKWCFLFSLSYNISGIAFAVTNSLTPFVAAVIMPLSSITVVALATYLSLRPELPGKMDNQL